MLCSNKTNMQRVLQLASKINKNYIQQKILGIASITCVLQLCSHMKAGPILTKYSKVFFVRNVDQ